MPGLRDEVLSPRDAALADATVSQALKDLLTRIIPEKRFDDMRELVKQGVIDPLDVPEKHPLMSPVSQVMATGDDSKKWLSALFSADSEAMQKAVMPKGYYGSDISRFDVRYGLERPPLLGVLLGNPAKVLEMVTTLPAIAGKVLGWKSIPQYGDTPEPLFHHLYNASEFTVKTLDMLEQLTGGTEFLNIRDSRGATMFHRIVSHANWVEDESKLDMASWMLQKNPQLLNDPDRFGWTPLDRLLARTKGELDSSMGRFLIVAGGRLERQMAAKFNVAAELDERSGKRLDKPFTRKLPGPGHSP